MDEVSTPIEVGSPVPEQLGQAVRTLLSALAGWMIGKGWIDSDIATAILPVIFIGVPFIWGQIRVRQTNAQKQTMAAALPDSIATTK